MVHYPVSCAVRLSRDVFDPGEVIEGTVEITLTEDLLISNIHLRMEGKERVSAVVDEVLSSKNGKWNGQLYGISEKTNYYYRYLVTLGGDRITGGQGESSVPVSLYNSMAFFRSRQNSLMGSENPSLIGVPLRSAPKRTFTLPKGQYVYPFTFALPEQLPPSYDTGRRTKDKIYSQSEASLTYSVKIQVLSPKNKSIANAETSFLVRWVCMAPLPVNQQSPTTVTCRFPVEGSCSCTSSHQSLSVTWELEKNSLQITTDSISVVAILEKNTTGKPIHGMTIRLIQRLVYCTDEAEVKIETTALESKSVAQRVEVGAPRGLITLRTPVLESSCLTLPTMTTTGLRVSYAIRVELLAKNVPGSFYTFEDILILPPPVPPGACGMSLCGTPNFPALPRGHFSAAETLYTIPTRCSCSPVIPNLVAHEGSRLPSRLPSEFVD